MPGPDRPRPAPDPSDGQTDPLIPRITDSDHPPADHTDPYLRPVVGPGPAPDATAAATADGTPGTTADDGSGVASSSDGSEAATGPQLPVVAGSGWPWPPAAVDTAGHPPVDDDRMWAEPARRPRWRRPGLLVPLGLLALLIGLYAVDLLVSGHDVPRNTAVAGIDIGGLSRDRAEQVLRERGVPAIAAARPARAGPVRLTVVPAEAGLSLDVDATVDKAAAQPLNPLTRLLSLFADRRVDAVLDVDQAALDGAMDSYAEQVDVPFVEGSIEIDGTVPSVVTPSDGRELETGAAASALRAALGAGSQTVDFPVREQRAQVSEAEAQQTLESFVRPALAAPVALTGGTDARTQLTPAEIAAALRFGPGDDGSLLAWLDHASVVDGIGPDITLFVTPPLDATFDISNPGVTVIPSKEGTAIDITALTDELMNVLPRPDPREVAVPVTVARPTLHTEEARTLNITAPVSTFTSAYTDPAIAKNIQLVAEAVDGTVLRPGETFSLNTVIGPRTAAEGYVAATAPGEGAPAVGGGISPFATAMLNAVFFAGLETVQYTPHPTYDASYPAGRDATVRADSTDLVWRDNTPNGVFVQVQWEPTLVTVSFWSTPLFYVEAVSESQTNLRPPPSQLRTGVGCVPSRGSTGFDITVTRVFKQPGTREVLREEEFTSSYAPVPRVQCAGEPAPPPVFEPPPPEVIAPPAPPPSNPTTPPSQPAPPPPPPPATTSSSTSTSTSTATSTTTSTATTTSSPPPPTSSSPPTTSPPATTTESTDPISTSTAGRPSLSQTSSPIASPRTVPATVPATTSGAAGAWRI